MNVVVVSGELRKVSQLKETKGGQTFCTFEIAAPRRKDEGADFIRGTAWMKTAIRLSECQPGTKLTVQGHWRTETIQMQNDFKRIDDLVVDSLEIVS